jgi:hypothetical protein
MNQRDHALMRRRFGGNRQLLARLLKNADPGLTAQGDQLFEARVTPLTRHQHVVKSPLPGFQSFFNRVKAVENIH